VLHNSTETASVCVAIYRHAVHVSVSPHADEIIRQPTRYSVHSLEGPILTDLGVTASPCAVATAALAPRVQRRDQTFLPARHLPPPQKSPSRPYAPLGWLGSRVVSVLDSGAEGPGFKSQPRRCRVKILGKLFTPIVPLFAKQQNW